MDTAIVQWIFIALVSSIPVQSFIQFLKDRYQDIDAQLIKNDPQIFFSRSPLIAFLQIFLTFFLSYGLCWFINETFYYNTTLVIAATLTVFSLQCLSPFKKFKLSPYYVLTLWGIYSFLYLPNLLLYPIIIISFSFLFNSFHLSILASVIFNLFLGWAVGLPLFHIPIHTLMFAVLVVILQEPLFNWIDGNKQSLTHTLNKRI